MQPMTRNRLRELRQESGFSQVTLAAVLGVDPSTVSRWESGVSRIPDDTKQQLAELLGCSVAFLMGWENGGNGHSNREVA